jgi:Domain of unknown function (DUF4173)
VGSLKPTRLARIGSTPADAARQGDRMTRSLAIRILTLAAVIGTAAQALLFDSLLGLNVPLLSGSLLLGAAVVRPRDRRIDPYDAWLPISAAVVSLAFALRADHFLLGLDVLALAALVGASVAAIGGERVTRRSAIRIVELGLLVLGWAGIGILRITPVLSRSTDGSTDGWPGSRVPVWFAPVIRGLLLAIPVLAVFAALFAAADLAFDALLSRLFTWDLDLGMLPIRLAMAFVIAWGVAGLLAVSSGVIAADADEPAAATPGRVAQSLGAAAAGLPSPGAAPTADALLRPLRLGAIEAATILVAVDLLFAAFVVVQIRYLFGGHDSLAVTGVPYAAYARSGFFELVWVAFLAGGLLTVVHAVAARRTLVLVAAGIALAALTGAVLVSALVRLRIYQDAYGWTELRFYVLASIVWLAIGIALTIVLLARDRMAWLLHGLAIAAVVVLVGINVVGPSRLIAEENVARVLNPSLVPRDGKSGLDIGYAEALGDDAVPALIRALPALPAADAADLRAWLDSRRRALAEPEATGWPAWNLGRERAREALATLPGR